MKSSVLEVENRKRASTTRKGEQKRKRVTEPRPHPPDCLNKRYWDDVRAGRIPEPHCNSSKQQKPTDLKLPSYFFQNQNLPYGSHIFPQPGMNLFPPPFNPSFPLMSSMSPFPQQSFGFNSKSLLSFLPEPLCLPGSLPSIKTETTSIPKPSTDEEVDKIADSILMKRNLQQEEKLCPNDPRYYSWMGLIHVKKLVRLLIYMKTFLFFIFISSVVFMNVSFLFIFACTVAFFIAIATYVILFTGIHLRKFHYFIPYFFTSFIFVITLVIQFFVDFLDSANTKDTLSSYRISGFLVQVFAISFEVYTLVSTWRLFNYICDLVMDEELEGKKVFHTAEEIIIEKEKEEEMEANEEDDDNPANALLIKIEDA